jgi:hypothetical protein
MIGTPEDLRKEAEAMERLAHILSYARDKERLMARAAELRAQADRLEAEDQTPLRAGPKMSDPASVSRRGV